MEQLKVTDSERRVLKAMSRVNTYIRVGNWRRSMNEVRHKEDGVLIQFQSSTLVSLVNKGLLSHSNAGHSITALGGEAAIKGYYTPGGDIQQRGNALSN